MGNGGLRKALYFPAVVASRHNRALRQFAQRLRSRDKSNMLIIVARNVKSWKSNALLQPEARAAYARLLAGGWTDAIRTLNPREPSYTFWHYLRNAWERDAGMRLDHLLVSQSLAKRLVAAGVDRGIRGRENASDHAPAWITLNQQ